MKIKTPKDVGHYIASTRKALKWSQSDLAKKIGKDQRFVSKLENDPASVSFGTVLMVVNVLNINIDLHRSITSISPTPNKIVKPDTNAREQATNKVPFKTGTNPMKKAESGKLFSPSKKKPVIVSKSSFGKK